MTASGVEVTLTGVDRITPALRPIRFQTVRVALVSFGMLEEGWDSYGAPRLTPDVIARATALLGAMEAAGLSAPWAVPCSDGGITFEWGSDDEVQVIKVPAMAPTDGEGGEGWNT